MNAPLAIRTGASGRRSHVFGGLIIALVFFSMSALAAFAHGSAESSTTAQAAAPATGPVTLSFWEGYSGPLAEALTHLVNEFNSSQSKYKVDAVYKGDYPTVMSATIAAYRAHRAPDIAMVYDVGTATIMNANGVYVPVYKLMQDNNIPFATSDFLGGAASYYQTPDGKLDSLPFASSTPVLYYNKDMLAKIGAQPPKTWADVGKIGHELVARGLAKYGFSTGDANWVMFEQFSIWNGFHYATDHNGYDGPKGTTLLINSQPFVDMVNQFVKWEKDGTYYFGGIAGTQGTPAQALFIAGTIGMYIDSSAGYAAISQGAKFNFGVSEFPYVAGAPGAPEHTVVGGNSLWVIAGNPSDVYPGVAQFLQYLRSNSAQAYWSSKTGYVPVTKAAVQYLTDQGFYAQHPDLHVAIDELTNKPPTPWSSGIRLGDFPDIRNVNLAAFTAALAGKETPKAALDSAAAQGDKILQTFASQYGG